MALPATASVVPRSLSLRNPGTTTDTHPPYATEKKQFSSQYHFIISLISSSFPVSLGPSGFQSNGRTHLEKSGVLLSVTVTEDEMLVAFHAYRYLNVIK